MATRDRTGLFLRYREEARALHRRPRTFDGDHVISEDEEKHKLYSNDAKQDMRGDGNSTGVASTRRGGMEPDWVFAYNELAGDMAELEKYVEQLASLYGKHLLPSFGEKDTSELEHEIRLQALQLTKLLHSVEQKVRNISKQQPESESGSGKTERAIRANLQKRFAAPLQELSMSFRKKQKAYMDKLRDQRESEIGRDHSVVGTLIDVGDDSGTETYDASFSDGQLLAVEDASVLADERNQELHRVAENINDLAALVKDIASLVVDQGTVLDRVDYNLEEVKLKTTGAVRELNIANRYQKRRHALGCIVILCVACGIMFVVLVLKWTS